MTSSAASRPPANPPAHGRRTISIREKILLLSSVGGIGLAIILVMTVALGVSNGGRLQLIQRQYYPAFQLDRRLREGLIQTTSALQTAAEMQDRHQLVVADSLRLQFLATLSRRRAIAEREFASVDSMQSDFDGYYEAARTVTDMVLNDAAPSRGTDVVRAMLWRQRRITTELEARTLEDQRAIENAFEATREFQHTTWVGTALITGACVALLVLIAVVTVRSVVRPLREAVDVANRLAEGDMTVHFSPAADDEVGQLLDAMRRTVAYLHEMSGAADAIAAGNLTVTPAPRSSRDRFGNAFAAMVAYLKEMSGVAERLARGDLGVSIAPRSPSDSFGRSLGMTLAQMSRTISELRASEERQRLVLDTAPVMIGAFDREGRLVSANAAAAVQLRTPREELVGRPLSELVVPEERAAAAAEFDAAARGEERSFDARLAVPGAGPRWAECTAAPIREAGDVTGVLVAVRDVTEEKEAAGALLRSEARFRALVQHSSDVILVVDAGGRVLYASPSVERLYGYAPEALRGRSLMRLVHPDDVGTVRGAFETAADQPSASPTLRHRVLHADGSWRHVESVGTNLLHDPAVRGIVLNARDVTERTALEAKLSYQAFHDPLTGLANRALFRDRVHHAMARTARGEGRTAVLFLDLDNFKSVNDSLGHSAGDRLLAAVATRLLNATRGCDTVARLGGDEFAVLLEGMHTHYDAIVVSERITSALKDAILVDEREVYVTASIGIAQADATLGPDDLLRNADVAMYRAKNAGKGQHAVYDPMLHAEALERMQLESDLVRAVERGEFRLLYQPIVELESGEVVGAEALLRWHHPTRGVISPARFVPLAEETGLIVPLGQWVMYEACRQAQSWSLSESGPLTIAVNVSGRQLDDASFVDMVADALDETGLAPDALVVELTESTVIRNPEATLERLSALKKLGVRLAIDDFGTGHSALSYLQRFPIDTLKIDKAFVDRVARGGADAALARAIVALGDALSLRTVAEGIEAPAQRAILCALGCTHGQGYLFAHPLTPADMEQLLTRAEPLVAQRAPGGGTARGARTPRARRK